MQCSTAACTLTTEEAKEAYSCGTCLYAWVKTPTIASCCLVSPTVQVEAVVSLDRPGCKDWADNRKGG